jgi:hypothetical protein
MRGTGSGCRLRVWPLAAWALLLAPQAAPAAERYYLTVFGAQSQPKLPRFTHTFATFVRVADPSPNDSLPSVQAYTISWLPQTLKVRPFRCHDEPGVNLTLDATLKWACANGLRVSQWGPYEIDEAFFFRIYHRYARIENGDFHYKAIDPLYRGARTSDCIHAVSDVDPFDSRAYYDPIVRNGDSASRKLVRSLYKRNLLIDAPTAHRWLNAALGLDLYSIVPRSYP